MNLTINEHASILTVQELFETLQSLEIDTGVDIMSQPVQINGSSMIYLQKLADGTITLNDEPNMFDMED